MYEELPTAYVTNHEEDNDGADQHPRRASVTVPHVVMNLACLAWSL